jgi:hypothetical protein
MPSGYEPVEKAPDGLQLPFRAGAIGIPTHRLRTGITDDSATGEPNTMVDDTDYWTLGISILPNLPPGRSVVSQSNHNFCMG